MVVLSNGINSKDLSMSGQVIDVREMKKEDEKRGEINVESESGGDRER